MKRKFHNIFPILLLAFMLTALPSCHSSKKSKSEFYDAQIESLKHGKKESDKNGKGLSAARKKIVKEAHTWVGTPYGYGRQEKGISTDCSGMVMVIYDQVAGKKLPRNSAKQSEYCKRLHKKDVKPADLCFFATGKDPNKVSHVGIMVDDKNFIHASTKGVVVSDITQPYYVRTFICFGRVPD